ncbi:MAG: hypothetical protein HYW65_03670 [Candidatus Liptonbacteria bacterium]|nr:hypothetical protein [Candidatus Liptonbacteria bacterium]
MSAKGALVLDVGTTGVKAFVFNRKFEVLAKSYVRLSKKFTRTGWVEQNPRELAASSLRVLREAVRRSKLPPRAFMGFGITNQRETTILWDTRTGQPVYPAIVWEDARTKKYCEALQKKHGAAVRAKTGLPIDSYFSASKIHWILANAPRASKLARAGRLAFGTVDAWLLWNLTEGHVHRTDHTNASRTLLFDIKTFTWDEELLKMFCVPRELLPQAQPSASLFGVLRKNVVGAPLPVLAVCGDQQSALAAAGHAAGTTKVTYGTGAFIMQITGAQFRIQKPFFTTLTASRKNPYALEAKVPGCGAEVDALLRAKKPLEGALRNIARRVDNYLKKLPKKPARLIVDGGITQAPYLLAAQTAVSKLPVKKQKIFDGTALGIAKLIFRKS